MKACPFCSEQIQESAIKCRYCGEWLRDTKIRGGHDALKASSEHSSEGADKSLPSTVQGAKESLNQTESAQDASRRPPDPSAHDLSSDETKTARLVASAGSLDPRLQGVGGWLLLFVLGQMVCGPLQLVSEFGSETTSLSQISARFPQTAYILTIERIMTFGLIAFGFIVAVMLLRTKDPRPVSIAKLYLMTAPVLAVVMTFLYAFTDLPDNMRSQVIAQGVGRTIAVGIASLIWLMYFTKSKRVRATYFGAHIHIRTSLQPDDSEIWECGSCGREVSFDARVCPNCQADVSEVAIAPPTAIE